MTDFRLVYTRPADGGVSVVVPAPGTTEQEAAAAVPAGVSYRKIAVDEVPADRTFRDAWVEEGGVIDHDLDKVKEIAHGMRRAAREAELKPLDDVIAKQIPGRSAQDAEAARAAIRAKYAAAQVEIDAAKSVDEVRAALEAVS